ncbi:MAG: CopD family protein, partial [Micromonosporaceae bacterium]
GGTADGDRLGGALSAVRYVGYAGLVLLVGAAVALARLWPQRLSRTGAARLLWTGVGLVAASTVAGVWLQVPYTTGGPVTQVSGAALADVLATTYGRAHLVRLGVLAAAAWLLRRVTAGRATRGDLAVLAVLGTVGLGTWPVAGHPVTTPVPAASVAAGTVHLAAAAFWLGGLVVLAGILLRRADGRELAAILPVWSVWAATAVAALVLAGVVQAVLTVGTPGALLSTRYGLLLTAKVSLVAVVVAVAAYSRRTVRRLAATAPVGRPGGLRTAVALEAGLLAGVLVFSSVLVQTVPARTEVAAAEAAAAVDAPTSAPGPFRATTHSTLYALEVTVDPAATGRNAVDLRAYTHTGEPLPVVEWRGSASLPAAGVEGVDIPLSAVDDNHARGEVDLPLAGEWQLRLTLRISEIDQATVLVSVSVGPGG